MRTNNKIVIISYYFIWRNWEITYLNTRKQNSNNVTSLMLNILYYASLREEEKHEYK